MPRACRRLLNGFQIPKALNTERNMSDSPDSETPSPVFKPKYFNNR